MEDQPSVPRDKYRGNRNVPIVAERLAAAIQFREMSVKGAADRAGEKQQTIQRIVQGKTERCRHARRRRLAEVLDVSEEWLGGADVPPIPGLPTGTLWTTGNEEVVIHSVLDENLANFIAGAAALPPGYQLHWSRLTTRVLDAWQRDIDAGNEEAEALAGYLPPVAIDPSEPGTTVTVLLQRAASAVWWRLRLLRPIPLPEAPVNLGELSDEQVWDLALKNEKLMAGRGVEPDDQDTFARLASEALALLLEPWLRGERELNYEACFVLLRWLRGGMLLEAPPRFPTEGD